MTKILILGGTGEARALAGRLHAAGHAVVSALAGRTSAPLLPAGEVRIGGFGGAAGLADHLRAEGFTQLVDATHPFASAISANAVVAARESGVPLVRLRRPAWTPAPGAHWLDAADPEAAARLLPAGALVLLTVGHGGLAPFLARTDCRLVARMIEPPNPPLPAHATTLLDRPPYTLDGELALFEAHGVTHLVTKNAGGPQAAAKLEAARLRNVPVIMIARPPCLPAPEAEDVEGALVALGLAK